MKLFIHAMCDIGKVRANNQDMILVGNEFLRDTAKQYEFDFDSNEHPFLIAVADGMGGHKGGEYASEIVLREMNQAIRSLPVDIDLSELKGVLKTQILAIHSRLLEEGLKDPAKTGMGTTFVGVLFFQNSVFLINIGDSRMYRFRDGLLMQLSRDHSLSEMTGNPEAPKNIIVNSFGAGAKIFFDFENISERIIHEDKIILCSDGLSGELEDSEIELMLSENNDPSALVMAVKNKEAKDNISIVTIHYMSEEE